MWGEAVGPHKGKWLSDQEPEGSRYGEEQRDDDGRVEQKLLRAAALIECRCEVVASEGSSERGTAILQYDADYEEEGEDDLRIRQECLESLHLCREYYHATVRAGNHSPNA